MIMRNLVLFDTQTSLIRDYPRADDEPVQGLDPRYVVLRVVREPAPDTAANQRLSETRTIDLDAGEWRWGWILEDLLPPPDPGPDYLGFYNGLLASQVYQGVVSGSGKTGDQATAMVVFLGVIHDTLSGRVNESAFQAAIWLLLSRIQLSVEDMAELQALVDVTSLSAVYSLVPD
jgi:hypothetical protein